MITFTLASSDLNSFNAFVFMNTFLQQTILRESPNPRGRTRRLAPLPLHEHARDAVLEKDIPNAAKVISELREENHTGLQTGELPDQQQIARGRSNDYGWMDEC